MTGDEITIRTSLKPGDLGRIIAFHGEGYESGDVHFGLNFEAFVARTVAEFMLDLGGRGEVFLAEKDGELVSTAAMVERRTDSGAHGQLRWVLSHPSIRGRGVGGKLVRMAIDYARRKGWESVVLETTPGLDVSMGLYERLGFSVEETKTEKLWEGDTEVIRMRLPLE